MADPDSYLRADNVRLVELERRYGALAVPMVEHSQWTPGYIDAEVDLERFRGELAYVWQRRDDNDDARVRRTYEHLRAVDHLGLLDRLTEDGAFGVTTWTIDGRTVTRDLLDSVAEMLFLDRHLDLSRRRLRVLDIGAGYGRLAHRLVQAFPGQVEVLCTDGVAVSTFLAEYYLRYRGASPAATVVPLDEIDDAVEGTPVDVAVNVHSFSECTQIAVTGWVDLLVRHGVRDLMVVPNAMDNGGVELLSTETDGRHLDLMPLLTERGFERRVDEPKYLDPAVQAGGVSPTRHHLFHRPPR